MKKIIYAILGIIVFSFACSKGHDPNPGNIPDTKDTLDGSYTHSSVQLTLEDTIDLIAYGGTKLITNCDTITGSDIDRQLLIKGDMLFLNTIKHTINFKRVRKEYDNTTGETKVFTSSSTSGPGYTRSLKSGFSIFSSDTIGIIDQQTASELMAAGDYSHLGFLEFASTNNLLTFYKNFYESRVITALGTQYNYKKKYRIVSVYQKQ